jgi:hypothetical protein
MHMPRAHLQLPQELITKAKQPNLGSFIRFKNGSLGLDTVADIYNSSYFGSRTGGQPRQKS